MSTSGTVSCPVCGTEYEGWSTRCSRCGVALVSPTPEQPRDDIDWRELPDEDRVVYEMGAYPLDLQGAAAAALAESEIPHAYDGTDLVVHVDDEARVDALLEELEREHGYVADEEAPVPAAVLEEGGEELAYELDEWSGEERRALARKLDEAEVAHRWESGSTLVVSVDDEDLVESLLDAVEYPDALDEQEPGEETNGEVLAQLFVAADRLKGDPSDAGAFGDLSLALEVLDPDRPPYGVAPALWTKTCEMSNELRDVLLDETVDDDDAADKARQLRDLLRPYV